MAEKSVTKQIVGTALFSALAFVISLLEFPIFPSASFLQLDFSMVFITLAGFIFGAWSGITCSFIKELLRFIIGSGTGGVGEIANFIVTVSFVLMPTLVYHFKKGLPTVIITLAISCVLQAGVALLTNRFINFPLFMGEKAGEWFSNLWHFVLLFNLIKGVATAILTILLYKRISYIIKKI
ncbi:MAG: ECF transporter S component [Clostridia bacterium]|nr:ECF transporter S component [Clostridia bacterium]